MGTITDEAGAFSLQDVPARQLRLRVSMVGFADATIDVDLTAGQVPLKIVLKEVDTQLTSVIVTATKREAEAQNIPLAVTTIGAQQIQALQIDNINEVGRSIPNFRTYDDGGGNFPLIAVRGIATISDIPVVGIYVDDVPLFNTASFPSVLQNVERIEVLRGPQGTLYGRNSLGGVINIVSKRPGNKTKGWASASYGSLNELELNGGFSTPLVKDKLFFSLDGNYSSRDGYITNTFLDQKELLGRQTAGGTAQLSWLVNDKWSVRLRTGLEARDINAYALSGSIGNTGATLDSLRENHPYEVSFNTEGNYLTTLTNNALTLNYFGDNLFFKSITTLQTTDTEVIGDEFDFTQFDLNES
ncbi:MAG: TonB-dependent receptor plug domain-containing protein, partial [Bacteroidota bacterium]